MGVAGSSGGRTGGRAVLLDGDAFAAQLRTEVKIAVAGLMARGITPHLATILVGTDPASERYIGRKHADLAEAGIGSTDIRRSASLDLDALLAEIAGLNADPGIHGVLVQLPLPVPLDEAAAISAVSPAKDVDGLHPLNLGRLVAGWPGTRPCTPAGILALLRHHGVPLAGRHVVIVGRGQLTGRPLGLMLSAPGVDATVTLTHSRTPDLGALTRQADIVIAAVGKPDLIKASMLRPGAAVVGIGISMDAEGRMVSDIADDVADIAGFVTPRHGSVGAVTRAMLMKNLVAMVG